MGLNISLPFEQYRINTFHLSLILNFIIFFMKNSGFAYLTKALVIMPGGFGTLDELMEILTLVQTEKLYKKKMAVVVLRKSSGIK